MNIQNKKRKKKEKSNQILFVSSFQTKIYDFWTRSRTLWLEL